ncbi:MAG: replication-relaxation family protein [Bdellovibrionaceae bacterium]|nr:replication-relaxation family protein [Pseudobdellovibrionaceae bacterium]
MQNLNKQPSVILTERDFFILKGLYDFTLMSFPQLAKVFFAGNAKPTIINRLSKLEQCGFITKTKLPRFITGMDKKVISVVYQISRLGIRELQKRFSDVEFHPEPVRLQPFSIEHDLLLVDVLLSFKVQRPDMSFVLGEHFCRFKSHLGVKPDAIITDMSGKMALELELTAKSERRYRELILKYRLAKDFESVVYITSSDAIRNKIQSLLGGFGMTSKFKFMSLGEVLLGNGLQIINQSTPSSGAESEVKYAQ